MKVIECNVKYNNIKIVELYLYIKVFFIENERKRYSYNYKI